MADVLGFTDLPKRESASVISAPVWNMLNEQAALFDNTIASKPNVKSIAVVIIAVLGILFIVKKVS